MFQFDGTFSLNDKNIFYEIISTIQELSFACILVKLREGLDINLFHFNFLFNSEMFQDEIILIIFNIDIRWFTLIYRICYLLCIYFKSIALLRMLRANIESL